MYDESITLHSSGDSVMAASTLFHGDFSIGALVTNPNMSLWEPVTEKMPKNSKTVLYKRQYDKALGVKLADNHGNVGATAYVMPDIEDVVVIENDYFPRKVIVTFSDGTTEKATVDNYDIFAIDQGISVCVAKKLLSNIVGSEHGSSVYNKIIDRGLKVLRNKTKERETKKHHEAMLKEKREKLIEKKRQKRIKRENAEREKQIEIQKEAYLRAMREYNTRSAY